MNHMGQTHIAVEVFVSFRQVEKAGTEEIWTFNYFPPQGLNGDGETGGWEEWKKRDTEAVV